MAYRVLTTDVYTKLDISSLFTISKNHICYNECHFAVKKSAYIIMFFVILSLSSNI